jgi:hypothetical protein
MVARTRDHDLGGPDHVLASCVPGALRFDDGPIGHIRAGPGRHGLVALGVEALALRSDPSHAVTLKHGIDLAKDGL